LDWIEQCFTSPPTQYRLYGRRFLQVKRPNQQYQSTEGTYTTQITEKHNNHIHSTKNTANPLVYTNMGWLGDGSHRRQVRHAWTAVGLPPRYPLCGQNPWPSKRGNHAGHPKPLQLEMTLSALRPSWSSISYYSRTLQLS